MLGRWFEKKLRQRSSRARLQGWRAQGRASFGRVGCLRHGFKADSSLGTIDVGYTSPANINYLTSLGHSVFLADLVSDAWHGDWRTRRTRGRRAWNVEGFLDHRSSLRGASLTWCLLWTALDYLPEAFGCAGGGPAL